MIPKEWEKHLLGDGIKLISGRHILAKDYSDDPVGIPYLTGPADFQNGKIIVTKYTQAPEVLCNQGDTLVTVKGSGTGQVILSDNTYCISRQLMAVRSEEWNNIFVYHSLKRNISRYTKAARGLIPGISREDILYTPILIPPLPEQRKIAEILSTWDKAFELVGKQIEAKQRLKKGLMQQLLTGKKRFPGFEDKWTTLKLGEIGDFSKGSGIRKTELLENGIPCIRYGERYTSHNYIIKEFYSFIGPEIASNSTRIFDGDILFAGSGETPEEIGKCVAYTGKVEAYAGGDVIILRLSEGNQRFMGYLLNHDIVNRQKYMYGQGHSVVHIYSRFLKDIVIPFPSIEEQVKIAELLDTFNQEIDSLYNKLNILQLQKQGLMQKLLTGEVMVKV